MNFALILLALFQTQADEETAVQKAAKKLGELKSYSYKITIRKEKETTELTGIWTQDGNSMYLWTDKGAIYRHDGDFWAKGEDGVWKEVPKKPKRPRPGKGGLKKKAPTDPHELAKKLADVATKVRKQESSKVSGKTCDVYVNDVARDKQKKAMEANGQGFGSAWLDFTPTKTGLFFHVGRSDKMLYRIEQVYSTGKTSKKEDDVTITIDYAAFNRAKIPAKVKKLSE